MLVAAWVLSMLAGCFNKKGEGALRMTLRCILSRTARNRCNSACNQKLINNESGKDSKDEVDALSFISEKSARSYLSEKAILTNAQCHSSMLF